jgi:hypothetical protein
VGYWSIEIVGPCKPILATNTILFKFDDLKGTFPTVTFKRSKEANCWSDDLTFSKTVLLNHQTEMVEGRGKGGGYLEAANDRKAADKFWDEAVLH